MDTALKHIVFLTPGFAENERNSTLIPALQVYLKAIIQQLSATQITIISFQYPFTNTAYYWHGAKVIPLNGHNRYLKPYTWWKALQTLKKINLQHPISIIHSFWIGECSLIGSFFSKKHTISHLVTAMGQDVLPKNKYVNRVKHYPQTSFISLSNHHQSDLLRHHQIKSQIIPWGINQVSFPEIQKNEIDILGVGSLNRIKNYFDFLMIIYQLVKVYPRLKVEIIGEGDQYQPIKNRLNDLNLENNVALLGGCSRAKVLDKMTRSSILLHTSSYESFGYVFSEALYAGMCIVSYDVGIAHSDQYWAVGKTQQEFVCGFDRFLKKTLTEKKRILFHSIKSTVDRYLTLYYA